MVTLCSITNTDFVMMLEFATLYFILANIVEARLWLWPAFSIFLFFLTRWLDWGRVGEWLGQLVLLAGIAVVRYFRGQMGD